MQLSTLSEWLSWIGSVHNIEIDLGLDRVRTVAKKLSLLDFHIPIIIVGGTNGKGSTVAGLEAIYQASGYRVGAFTSPILFKHNEQVRIASREVADELFCQAFEKIECARGDISLSPFEYHTLAALIIFKQHDLDALILEVGLGGRLDAVNILDADVAVVTSIGIDHVEYLGDTREKIAVEKAGIFRSGRPAVCGDPKPPQTLISCAREQHAVLFCQHQDFYYETNETSWSWHYQDIHYLDLPITSLMLQNMSTVLMAITLLQPRLPVTVEFIKSALKQVSLTGRIQIKPGAVTEIYDVSHNPAAVNVLVQQLQLLPCAGTTHAVFSMLTDKDIVMSIKAIQSEINMWYAAPIKNKRAASVEKLHSAFQAAQIDTVYWHASVKDAYLAAKAKAARGDRIIVFGSFHTIAEVLM